MNLQVLLPAAAFLLGLLFGSFLNVCIARLPRHESIVHPASHCPNCHQKIRWYDNIPVISWLLLNRRCRDCHQPVSAQYPLVELAVAAWFAIVAHSFTATIATTSNATLILRIAIAELSIAILGFLLIGLVVMDWQTLRLPDSFTLTGIAIGLFLICTQAIFLSPGEDQVVLNTTHQLRLNSPGSFMSRGNVFLTGPEALIFGRIAAAAGVALLLLLIRWLYRAIRHREGMGLGDIKLIAMIAAFLGFWPAILALFLGVFIATLYAGTLLARKRASAATKLPFGSFLAIGGLISAIFGARLIEIYTSFLR